MLAIVKCPHCTSPNTVDSSHLKHFCYLCDRPINISNIVPKEDDKSE